MTERFQDAAGNLARPNGEAARAVKGDDVLAIGLPHALAAAALGEEANPGEQVAGIRPDAVGGPDANARTLSKETIELEIVAAIVAENEWGAVDEFRTASR